MELHNYILGTVLIITAFGLERSESGLVKCPDGEFFNSVDEVCQKCATCKGNDIVRKSCGPFRDTQCGPFWEFQQFLMGSSNNRRNKTHNHHNRHHNTMTSSNGLTTSDTNKLLDLTSVSSGEEQWRTLAMGLIGVLCVVSVFLVVFVFAVCYVRSRRPAIEKDIIYDSDYLPPSDTYIQVQAYTPTRMSSRDRLKTTKMAVPTDYDSGSEDGCPCTVQVASSSRLLPPVYIPPVTDDYDADHSGASTIKSSDYVYFNCPQNGNQVP